MENEERPAEVEETLLTDEERQAVKLRRKRLFRFVTILVVFAVILVVSFLIRGHFKGKYDSVQALQEYIRKFGVFGPLILAAFQVCMVVIPVFPSFPGCAAMRGRKGSFMFCLPVPETGRD